MKVPDAALDELRRRGFVLLEGFLAPEELEAARRALWLHFPTPEEYFAEPARHPRYAASQFAGVEEFPYRSWDLNRLPVHPDLVDAVERYLGTRQLHLYKVELWAKYAGAVDYEQPLHRDYGSHSLVVPRPEPRYQQVTTFVYLSDVGEEDGPTRIVPYEDGRDVPYTPLYLEPGALAEAEVPAVAPAGSLLLYRTDILHRGSNLTGPGRARFSLLADFQVRGTTWGGKMAWPKQSPQRWAKLMPTC
ncbi:MAG TPA: phytanoyl-CoA dioxygenase family protein, partial [Acidimicrobiales bacterium]|nr:phytanoyl-CoA dioxygenase family protein [Acidimicrobiales bacterium]